MDFRRVLPEIRWQSRLSPGSRVCTRYRLRAENVAAVGL
jgi:hypothetical protein